MLRFDCEMPTTGPRPDPFNFIKNNKNNNNINRQLHQPQTESRKNETNFNDDARFAKLHQSTFRQRYSTK